jgi:hypothetical protein
MTRTKKAPKETKIDEVVAEAPVKKEKPAKGIYHLYVELNDKAYETDTNDIAEAIRALRPNVLKTSLVIKVTKDNKTLDRYLYLNNARRLFLNRLTLESFVKNLLF